MSKKLKLFGLLALTVALGAGTAAAWINNNTLTLSGVTHLGDINVDKDGQNLSGAAAGFNTISGYGTVAGSILTTGKTFSPMVLGLEAANGNVLKIAPENTTARKNRVFNEQAVWGNQIQVLVNQANDGEVLINASNADAPTAAFRTIYTGGTFAFGGTLAATNNNSLGQRWVAIQGRPAGASRAGAIFKAAGTTQLVLGTLGPGSTVTNQPFYLVRDKTDGAEYDGAQLATIKVDNTGSTVQDLRLEHGLGEVRTYTDAAPGALVSGDTNPDTPLAFGAPSDTAIPATGIVGAVESSALISRAARLVKTGDGTLTIDSNGPLNVGYGLDAISGARHTGGTDVLGGTLVVKGRNATTEADRFTGYLGAIWKGTWGGFNFTVTTQPDDSTSSAYAANACADGAIHNPLAIRNEGSRVFVDRSQFFSFFNSDKGTYFTAKEFTVAGVPHRPQIAVTLNGFHSAFNGTLGTFKDGTRSSFDLVVHSVTSTAGLKTGGAPTTDPSQAMLTLGNPSNDITGETIVTRGVLAVAGAKSIAHRGTGNLYVGVARNGFTTGAANKGVFLGLADATFENKTFVSGTRNAKPAAGTTNICGDGALAAATGTTASYKDVIIRGAMEINPQAVGQTINTGAAGAITWTNTNPYPTWGGTVRFGGEGASYDIGGTVIAPTQIAVSRGAWKLDSYPVRPGGAERFAQVMLRQTATLVLGEGVWDFSKLFDLQVDNDARIRLTPNEKNFAANRSAAMAKDPLFKVRTLDVTWLGSGTNNKDRRLAVQLDLKGKTLKKGQWIKVVEAEDAIEWNNLHYLREQSGGVYEDYVKIRPGIVNLTDNTNKVVAHVDENSYTILFEVLEDTSEGGEVEKPTPKPNKPDGPEIGAPATVEPGKTVTFTLGDWYHNDKKLAAGDVTNIVWTLDGKNVTAQVKGGKLEVNAPTSEGTMTLKITGDYKGEKLEQSKSVTVKKAGEPGPGEKPGPGKPGGGSGGCDAGFGALGLALAAAFLLKRKA